jgi:apolipoprotein D and lipocalin family protein
MRHLVLLGAALISTSCTQLPEGVTAVSPFDVNRYLGEWHEIARLDHRFERGLTDVSAHYSLRPDGGLKVINKGYNAAENEWDTAEGKAYFVDDTQTGRLKVSFFGPFYGGYNIAKLEADYSMALVVGPSLDYAWILARSTTPAAELCQQYKTAAEQLGIQPTAWIQVRSCKS